jgi:pimeloyl-ACP methyl ester carboxylesterase
VLVVAVSKARGQDAGVPAITVNGVELYYEAHGSGAPLVAQFDATTRFDCTNRLPQIKAPTVIVHGTSDRIAPLAMAEQMRELIPNSRLVLIDGGHLAPLLAEHQRLVSEIRAFLAASP